MPAQGVEASKKELMPFPGTRPKPHEMKAYLDDVEDTVPLKGLTPTANGKLPSRVSALFKWPEHLCQEPPAPAKGADEKTISEYRKRAYEAAKCAKANAEADQLIKTAVRDDRTALLPMCEIR